MRRRGTLQNDPNIRVPRMGVQENESQEARPKIEFGGDFIENFWPAAL